MARLPKVEDNAALLQQPRSRLSAADIANPYQQIASAFGAIGTWAQERSIDKAGTEGANGVYRDPDGNLKVDLRSDWSKSGQAYNRAAMQAYTARIAGDIRTNGAKLATDSQGNVDTFNQSWKGFSDGLLKGVPEEARGALTTMLETEGSRLGLGVSEQKRTRDIKVFEGNIKSEIELLDNEMATLARNGGTNTPDYLEKQGQMRSLWGELAANPEFTVGDKEADIAVTRMQSRHQSEAIVGTVETTLETGGVGEARKLKERILSDESLKLTPAERRQYAGLAEARIDGWVAEQKVALAPWQDKKKKLTSLLDEGVGIDSPDIDETALSLARGGDVAGAMELYAARARARALSDFTSMNNTDQAAALQRGLDAANGIDYGQSFGLVAAVRQVESGGDPNAVSSAGALGSMQVMPGTAAEIADEIGDRNFPRTPEAQAEYLKRDDVSTRYGTHYLNKMLTRYGGDVEAALVAYNGGPDRADKWLAAGRDDSVLPGETADYYKKVLAVPGARGGDLPIVTEHQAGRVSAPDMSGVRPDVLTRFKAFQNAFGASIPVVSGFRDPKRNARAGGAKSSQHLRGNALDLDVSKMSKEERLRLIRTASAYGFTGIGVYENSIHLDTGSRRAWGPDHRSGSIPGWAKAALDDHRGGKIAQVAPATGPQVDPKVIKEFRAEVTSDAKTAWEDMQAGLKKGIPPDPGSVELFKRQFAMVDDEDFKSEVARFLEAEIAGGKIADLPGDQAAAIISALKADADDGATIAQQEILSAAERGFTQKQEALKADPIGWAVDHRVSDPVPAIDVSQGPEGLASAFGGRQRAVDLLRARGEVGNVSALRPEDEKTIGRIFQTATPAEQAQFIGTMQSALKPDTYMATIEKLAGKDGMKGMAAAGALYAENPEVAEGILRGQALLRENPKFAPAKTDANASGIDAILPPGSFAPALEGARQQVLDAATARYADLSSVAGDTSADLNSPRMEQAVNEVTGGMLDMNGSSIIAPRYGMSQDEFDGMLDGLTDADLADAITSDGTPITARDLRTYGRLKAVGAGQYMLEFGPDWSSGSFALARPDFGDRSERVRRGVFVLDLGAR